MSPRCSIGALGVYMYVSSGQSSLAGLGENGERCGEPLERLLGVPMDQGRFLPLAIRIADALTQFHQQGLVHEDWNPANIWVEQASGVVHLSGSSLASHISHERKSRVPPESLMGTLAYMAPERTGRMNRSVDFRSDLYSLGVTLYQMLTGSLPFCVSDALEWVHCHIARSPVPPGARLRSVPGPVSALVMKLLAKTPEERYQTAAGVAADLRRCLDAWEAHGRIDDFPLGQRDIPDRLLIPERLYGREREIETLFAALERVVASGCPQMLLVSGYSGIGKSAVVNELHRMLVPTRSLFASGKFDQYKRDVPYATLAQALQSVVRSVLAKSDTVLAGWRHALLQALGTNGRLMTDLVPELTLIVDEQPPVPDLPPQESKGRFQLVVRSFIGVLARPEHPLILFLDDLQWLDAATVDLLEDLLVRSPVPHLMLIGAYRDNAADVSDAWLRKMGAMKSAGAQIEEITLAPLTLEHLGQLLADALHCEAARAAPLAELIYHKTGGNPFFAIQFIHSLAEEGLLSFDHSATRWSWDLSGIHARGYTDNVVDLMVRKLQRLDLGTREALKQLSCLGNTTPIATWNLIHGGSDGAPAAALYEAIQVGLVLQLEADYRFLHDRVHEAAYSLFGPAERATAHLRIGRLLMAGLTHSDIAEQVFDIANHFNRALELIPEPSERDLVRSLNVTAGRRARAASAYTSARYYLLEAVHLSGDEAWQERYADTFALHLDLAECEYLTGNFAQADVLFALMLERAVTVVDRAKVYRLQMQVYQLAGRHQDAVAAALLGLQLFDVTFPEADADIGPATERELAGIRASRGSRSLNDLLQEPLSSRADVQIISSLLGGAMSPMYIARPRLWPLLVARAVNIFLRSGNTEESCIAYASYGSILVALFGEIAEGFAMSRMAVQLNERLQGARLKGQVLLALGACVNLWNRPFGSSVGLLEQAIEDCLQVGDLAHAGYAPLSITGLMLERGDALDGVAAAISRFESLAQRSHNKALQVTLRLQRHMLDELRGEPHSSEPFDEGQAVAFLENANYRIGIAIYRIGKVMAAFILGRYSEALAFAAAAQVVRSGVLGQIYELTLTLFQALASTLTISDATLSARTQCSELINGHRQKLQLWSENCPQSFADRAALLSAQIARIEGRELEAPGLYERAIRLARANGFIHTEALAHELAARFYLERSLETSAGAHLRHAVDCYGRWGAHAKVKQLQDAYRRLQTGEVPSGDAALAGAPVRQLDVATVIKASQALSKEMLLPKLIQRLMTIALENAGASRALLAVPHGETYRIEAEALACGDNIEVRILDQPMAGPDCPETILRYVTRTREKLILDDATQPSVVCDEAYQRARQPRSVLCLPLLREGRLPGLLYLENTLTSHAFTPDRVGLLELLAGQAAISLENTRLYTDLAARERRFRQLVDSNMIGITFWEIDGRIHETNDAFLALTGYSSRELLSGKFNWWAITPPEHQAAHARAFEQLSQSGAFAPYETECICKDGRRIPILIGGAFEEGSREHGVAFVLDLSERNRAETERRARQIAEAANHAKSQFLATVSHDLRTPLNAILGYAQVLRRTQLPEDRQRAAVRVIQHSGEQLLTLIDDVLDLAKIEAGRFELHAADFSLDGFLGDLIDVVGVSARSKALRLLADWGTGLPARVHADAQCLRRVMLNLLSNAVRFTDSGSVTLRVSFSPPQRLRFEVSDTGIGIRADQLERIFEPFEQVADLPRRAGGTGLGLTISRRLVAHMGGELRAHSRVGQGSTFWFDLQVPVSHEEAEQASPAAPIAVTGYEAPAQQLTPPPEAEIEVLYALAQQGCMSDIRRQAEHVASLGERYRPFARRLVRLAEAYQSRALLELVERYRQRPG